MNNSVHVQYFLLGFVSTLLLSVWISFAPSIFNYTQSYNSPRPMLISYRISQLSNMVENSGSQLIREASNVKQIMVYRYYGLGLTCSDIDECQNSINTLKDSATVQSGRLRLLAFDLVGYQREVYAKNLIAAASMADSSIKENQKVAVLGVSTQNNDLVGQVYEGAYDYLDNITFGALSSVKY